MAIRKYKPTSPALRQMTVVTSDDLSRNESERSLTKGISRRAGRNSLGRITVRHRGGGHKRRYRVIDFKRLKRDIQARVASIEYDPNRSSRIALVVYADGEKRYIIAPAGLKVGDQVMAGQAADIRDGNALPLKSIPLGTLVHNIELKPGKGAQLVRSAGAYAQLMAKEGCYAHIKLPSSEVRLISQDCYATIGQISNEQHENISVGKAGRKRNMGWRPTVRGVVMNPVDHPHGGGEGKSKGGNHPVTPWGQPTKGYRTRKRKSSDRYIINRRK